MLLYLSNEWNNTNVIFGKYYKSKQILRKELDLADRSDIFWVTIFKNVMIGQLFANVALVLRKYSRHLSYKIQIGIAKEFILNYNSDPSIQFWNCTITHKSAFYELVYQFYCQISNMHTIG